MGMGRVWRQGSGGGGGHDSEVEKEGTTVPRSAAAVTPNKRNMSKAKRKRLKKDGAPPTKSTAHPRRLRRHSLQTHDPTLQPFPTTPTLLLPRRYESC